MKSLIKRLLQTSTLIGFVNAIFAALLMTPASENATVVPLIARYVNLDLLSMVTILIGIWLMIADKPRYEILFIPILLTSMVTIGIMVATLYAALPITVSPYFYLVYSSWTFFQLLLVYHYGIGKID